MGFVLPDIVVESIIRDGLRNARRDPTVIDDVFSELTRAFASKKYGEAEIEKIKTMIREKEVSVVHSYNLVPANMPCFSIQLADDRENEARAHMGNYAATKRVSKTKPEELADLIIVESFQPSGYDPKSGAVLVPDSVNLAPVYANLLFVDAAGTEHRILGGIVNEAGSKQFLISKNAEVSLGAGAEIKSSLDYRLYTVNGNVEQTQLIIGVHTKDALTTKYLYVLLKYFLLSRRRDLISRGLQLTTHQGSDFTRNLEYSGDVIYARFLSVSATVQNRWIQDKVELVDNIQINVQVPKDRLGNEALGLTDSTITVKE